MEDEEKRTFPEDFNDSAETSFHPTQKDPDEKSLCKRLQMENQGEANSILRMLKENNRVNETLFISQPSYLQNTLKRLGMNECKPISTPIEAGKRFHKTTENEEVFDSQRYQEIMGCLTYASTCNRPDISAAVGMLSQFNANPSHEHWTGVKRVLGTLNYGLKFFVHKDDVSLYGYSDADRAQQTSPLWTRQAKPFDAVFQQQPTFDNNINDSTSNFIYDHCKFDFTQLVRQEFDVSPIHVYVRVRQLFLKAGARARKVDNIPRPENVGNSTHTQAARWLSNAHSTSLRSAGLLASHRSSHHSST
eukprot:gene16510-18161_t